MDSRIEKLADVLINYACAIKSGERILIEAIDVPHEFTKALVKTAAAAGGARYHEPGGPVEVKTTSVDVDHVQVTITNKTRYTLRDCALVNDKSQNISVGTLAPGETRQVKAILTWAYRESSTSVHLPPAPAEWQAVNSVNSPRHETPDQVRNNLRYALTQALANTNSNYQQYPNYNMNGEEDVQAFGKATNALVAWVDTSGQRILDVQIDGRPASGEEADLLYIHLPPAPNLPTEVARATNPFLIDPILNLKEEPSEIGGRLVQ